MKNYLLFFLLLASLLTQEVSAKTLHAILVADTVSNISEITRPDLKNIQQELKTIAKHTKATLKEKIFSGSNFKKDVLIDYLNELKVESSDVVFFYFSGHGYRTMEKTNAWPFLAFELYKSGIDLQWIADTIWTKKPQFALVMSDCCNNYAERGFNPPQKKVLFNLHRIPPYYQGYDQLFSKAKGCVVMSSCSAGQYSYGGNFGGIFTTCFLASMNKEIAKPTPSWKSLMERTSSYIKHIQKPICQVYH